MPRRVSKKNVRRRGGDYGNLNEGKCYSNPLVIKHLMNDSVVFGAFGTIEPKDTSALDNICSASTDKVMCNSGDKSRDVVFPKNCTPDPPDNKGRPARTGTYPAGSSEQTCKVIPNSRPCLWLTEEEYRELSRKGGPPNQGGSRRRRRSRSSKRAHGKKSKRSHRRTKRNCGGNHSSGTKSRRSKRGSRN